MIITGYLYQQHGGDIVFKQGEYIMYSNYGVCFIDEIKDKVMDKEKKTFYILHPVNDNHCRVMTPIDNKKVKMRALMSKEDAKEVITMFNTSHGNPILDKKQREREYTKIIKDGDPFELVRIINSLVKERKEREAGGKKFPATDKKYLDKAEGLLYSELSASLNIELDEILEKVNNVYSEDY